MLIYLLSIADENKKQDVIYIFNKYHTEMLTAARVQFKNAGVSNWELEAEDAVQNAFVKITRYINTIKGKVKEENVRAYLYAITNNEVNAIISDNIRSNTESAEEEEMIDDGEFVRRLEMKEQYDIVVEAIKQLDEKYSTVLLLRYCGEISVKRIAKFLGLKPQTVYKRIKRGKRRLLELLEKEGKI